MQAVILVAGKSTRTYPLTLTKPKPLLRINNEAIIEHNINILRNLVDDIILVVGFKKDLIKDFISKKFPKLNVVYVEQDEQLGTGHAVLILEEMIRGKFLLMLGDNVYSEEDIRGIVKHKYSILIKKVKKPENFGVILEKDGILKGIVEKPKEFISDLISCGLFSLDEEIFPLLKEVKKSDREEIELTDALEELTSKESIYCVRSKKCFQISFPWDLLEADKELRGNKNLIDKTSKIKGQVLNSTIGENCIVDGKVKNSIIMRNTKISVDSVIEDSIIGENVNFDGIAMSSDAKSIVKGKAIDAGRMGAIIGDNVTAVKVYIKPGCKIWPNQKITGEINGDLES